MKDKIKYIGRKLIYVYNIVYPVINTLIFLLMYEKLDNTSLIIFVIYLVIEYWIWIKRQIPYMRMLYDFLAKVTDKSVLAIYGGVGSGKTTLATYLMNKYYPKESHYYNFKVDGAKIFNHQHLFLKEKLIEKPCVLIDEAGGFYDSFKYDKKYNAERKEIITFNKYFRQFYGDGLCIYVDQAESNLNTALYRSIYFVVQLDSIRTTMSSPVMYMFYKLIQTVIREYRLSKVMKQYKRKDFSKAQWRSLLRSESKRIKVTNIFSFQEFSYFTFSVVGDYGNHYSINKDEQLSKFIIPSLEVFNNSFNTRIFKDYNPAKEKEKLYWGADLELDKRFMSTNFDLLYNEIKGGVENE